MSLSRESFVRHLPSIFCIMPLIKCTVRSTGFLHAFGVTRCTPAQHAVCVVQDLSCRVHLLQRRLSICVTWQLCAGKVFPLEDARAAAEESIREGRGGKVYIASD